MQRRKKLLGKALFFVTFLLSSCSYNNLILQKADSYAKQTDIKKIVVLDPQYIFIDNRKKKGKNPLKSYDEESKFLDILEKVSSQNKIELTVVNNNDLSNTDLDYFNYLIPLKKDILTTNLIFESTENNSKRLKKNRGFFKASNSYFKDNLEVDSKYSFLSEKFKTPYFSVTGVVNIKQAPQFNIVTSIVFIPFALAEAYTTNNTSIYYNFIVNVETGNIIYKELRTFQEPITSNNLEAVVIDSYKLIKK